MKTAIINKLEKIQASLEAKIAQKEEIFETRSETWQESERGENYMFIIDGLRTALDSVNDAIDTLTQ